MAAYLNSKRLIQGHALFLFILAVYLTKSPEVITDSDVVYFTLRDTIKIVRLILLLVHFQIMMNLSLLALGGRARPDDCSSAN
jgi:Ilm1 (Increased loss of mitochondrial DNA 1) protein